MTGGTRNLRGGEEAGQGRGRLGLPHPPGVKLWRGNTERRVTTGNVEAEEAARRRLSEKNQEEKQEEKWEWRRSIGERGEGEKKRKRKRLQELSLVSPQASRVSDKTRSELINLDCI